MTISVPQPYPPARRMPSLSFISTPPKSEPRVGKPIDAEPSTTGCSRTIRTSSASGGCFTARILSGGSGAHRAGSDGGGGSIGAAGVGAADGGAISSAELAGTGAAGCAARTGALRWATAAAIEMTATIAAAELRAARDDLTALRIRENGVDGCRGRANGGLVGARLAPAVRHG